ncbi:MAG: hypothetical protein AAF184_20315 [Pseudomonadota bacterium]
MRVIATVMLALTVMASPTTTLAQNVGFEILELTPEGLITWINFELTEAQFDAIELPPGWFKNEPREGDPDASQFLSSPDLPEGEFRGDTLFGYDWTHVATVIDFGLTFDEQGLLSGSIVNKRHEIVYFADHIVTMLISPEGDVYPRVSRDLNRPTDDPTVPAGWRLVEYPIERDQVLRLPDQTVVIRADNEDSFQGPVWCLPRGACRQD